MFDLTLFTVLTMGTQGFEPRLTALEAAVLARLDDVPYGCHRPGALVFARKAFDDVPYIRICAEGVI